MKKGITIDEFLKTKEITPEDLENNFEFVKRIDVDMVHLEGCPNCGDKNFLYSYPSPAWTEVRRCPNCNTIMMVYVADRMGGANKDTVDVYKEKTV